MNKFYVHYTENGVKTIYISFATSKNSESDTTHINRIFGTGYYAIILFYTETVIETDNGMINADAPSMIIFDKFSRQHYYSKENTLVCDLINFDADLVSEEKNIFNKLIFNKPFPIENFEVIQKLMWLIASEFHCISKYKKTNINRLFKILINKISEEINLFGLKKELGNNSGILYVKNKIIQNPGYNWTIKELAKECNMSESFFQVKYKKIYSSTCIADVITARLEMAKNLLKNSVYTIKEISSHCGYRRQEHFSRQFKDTFGISPGEYRKKHLNCQIEKF